MKLKTLAAGLLGASACWMCVTITLAICGQPYFATLVLGIALLVLGLVAALLDEYR